MKALRKMLDRVEPLFHKGGPLEKLYAQYEMIDTFLYTPGQVTKGPTHLRDSIDLKRTMITVIMDQLKAYQDGFLQQIIKI